MKKYIIIIAIILSTNILYGQWVQLEQFTDNSLKSVFFIDAYTGYAAGDNGIIAKSNDGGMNWEVQTVGEDMNVYSLYFPNKYTGYALGRYGNMVGDPCVFLKTDDEGMNWSINVIDSSFSLTDVHFMSEDTGYICGYHSPGGVTTGLILKTTSGGNDWSTLYEGYGFLNSLHFPDSNTGYTMGYTASSTQPFWIMQKTVDAGQTWITSNGPPYSSIQVSSVYFTDEESGYTVGENTILRTTDGGANWIAQDISLPNGCYLFSVFFTDLITGYIAAKHSTGGCIYRTINGGENWVYEDVGGNGLYSVHFPTMDTGYVVGYLGDIFKTTNGGGLPVGLTDTQSKSEGISVCPNPFTNITTISYTLKETSIVAIRIFNSRGQFVDLIEQPQAKGEQEVLWNSGGLPVGLYYVTIEAEGYFSRGKVVKME